MAGLGSRFKKEGFDKPKPLIKAGQSTLAQHSVKSIGLCGNIIFITRDFGEKENKNLSEHLMKIAPGSIEIKINNPTRGSVETCLQARHLINGEEELIITNCDQILEWDAASFLKQSRLKNIDGSILTYASTNSKNSFASVDNEGYVTNIVEKEVISNNALVGLHYWKSGQDFVFAADKLISDFENEGKKECYVSETYNYLITAGKRIKAISIEPGRYISLGTPLDVAKYVGQVGEFMSPKPKTIFCDIDGTILNHAHKFSDLINCKQELLPGVIEKFNEWDSLGHRIILCTARKESAREMTVKHLDLLGLCYDMLIMGVTSGTRVLINDKLSLTDPDRAISVNIKTDQGFFGIDWCDIGL
tara:strand:- start:1072 stop:2154 length:1083 start_codon:yes stop_codon:yes gene_type:complete